MGSVSVGSARAAGGLGRRGMRVRLGAGATPAGCRAMKQGKTRKRPVRGAGLDEIAARGKGQAGGDGGHQQPRVWSQGI